MKAPFDSAQGKILCLCGGVGGAKLALGFSKILPPEQLSIVVNTADDFEHLGFYISPDIDTVIYTLAGLSNAELGWGLAGESWQFMEALSKTDPSNSWFRLGDKDLQTHHLRKQLRAEHKSLSAITRQLSEHYGVRHPVIPMSDDTVSTIVKTATGELAFQHYFVREQCRPKVTGFYFKGIETARPATGFLQALEDPELAALVICPSNPFVSIDPILSLSGIRDKLQNLTAPVIAVSPIIGGQAIKGPTAKMMDELHIPKTSAAIAQHYSDIVDILVIDQSDAGEQAAVAAQGMHCLAAPTLMKTESDKKNLAHFLVDLAIRL